MSGRNAEDSIIVVGAGAAGLSTASALRHRGYSAIVLDRDSEIGGSWSRRYDSLHLHTHRRFSGLAHYPIPSNLPTYLSKDQYTDYLKEYATAQRLEVLLGEEVKALRPLAAGGNGWEVESNGRMRKARVVVIATGHYCEPWLPIWQGSEKFEGPLIHTAEYETGADYAERKVLVVGLGNSGAEIASDLCDFGAAGVSLSVRTPPPIVTREMFGLVPVQLLGIAMTPLGIPRIVDRVGARLRKRALGDLSVYGLAPTTWGPFTARRPAVIDTGFVRRLKQRKIEIRPEVKSYDARAVNYTDGSSEQIDIVIAATGYRTGLEKFLLVPGLIDDSGQPRFCSGDATAEAGLYFMGFDDTVRGHLFEINRDSRRLAKEIERYLST
ncbi:MAG: NAD(P)/FAD-dependent oxidoreductase [Gammaproteobacteria bacterium]|nr:NAD(P)/FAD-dependent oxidoreductase [Gammaproteobacteria bacterium]